MGAAFCDERQDDPVELSREWTSVFVR